MAFVGERDEPMDTSTLDFLHFRETKGFDICLREWLDQRHADSSFPLQLLGPVLPQYDKEQIVYGEHGENDFSWGCL